MFKLEELKDKDFDVIAQLRKKSDAAVREAVKPKKDEVTLLYLFAKYRTAHEFQTLLNRLPRDCIDGILTKWIVIILRSRGTERTVQHRRITLLHYVLHYQTEGSIKLFFQKCSTAKIIEVIKVELVQAECYELKGESMIPDTEKFDHPCLSWKRLLASNKKLNDTEMAVSDPRQPKKKKAKRQFPSVNVKIEKSIDDFVKIIEQYRQFLLGKSESINIDYSNLTPLTFELGFNYRDTSKRFKSWSLYHFVCAARARAHAHSRDDFDSGVTEMMRNLDSQQLLLLAKHKCEDSGHEGCNILHFALLYVSENDESIKTFCETASDEILNQLLCERAGTTGRHSVRRCSALQMGLRYLSQPCLEIILPRLTPETLADALRVDGNNTNFSDNNKTYPEIISSNEKLIDFDKNEKGICGTLLFYELYNYFKRYNKLKRQVDLVGRMEVVVHLIQLLNKPPKDDHLIGTLEKFYKNSEKFENFTPEILHVRSFKGIMLEICSKEIAGDHAVHAVKEGYKACKNIFHDYFMSDQQIAAPIEDNQEERSAHMKLR